MPEKSPTDIEREFLVENKENSMSKESEVGNLKLELARLRKQLLVSSGQIMIN